MNLLAKGLARRPNRSLWERSGRAPIHSSRVRVLSRGAQIGAQAVHVCYVTSHYPAVSHTFVMREIKGLRSSGVRVNTVSVHRANESTLLSEADRREAERTWSILPLRLGPFARAHGRAGPGAPIEYCGVLREALKAHRADARVPVAALLLRRSHRPLGSRRTFRRSPLHAHLANVAADICWWASEFGDSVGPARPWRWSFTMHGPTELYAVERFNLPRKVEEADLVACISDFTRSQLMYLTEPEHWAKLRVVHCGADLSRYRLAPPRKGPGFVVLCVARLAPPRDWKFC